MNDFEKYTKDTLNDYPSPVDETRLWGNIEQALREDKRRPVAFWILWLGCGLLVATGLAGYYWYGKNTPVTLTQPEKSIIASDAAEGGGVNNLRTSDSLFSLPPTPKGKLIPDKVENGVSFPAINSPLGVGGREKSPPQALKLMASGAGGGVEAQAGRQSPIPNISGFSPSNEVLTTILNPSDGSEPSNGASTGILLIPSDGSKPSDGALPAPVFLPILLQELAAANNPDISSNTKTGCSDWSKGPAFKPYFGVYGGAQYPMKTLQAKETEFENIVADRQETETILEGIAAGAYFGVKHRSGVFAEGGLEYNRINERFDRTTLRTDTIGKIAVIGIIVNAPGDTTFISDSIHILQETRSMKRTYNNYRFLQVPLALGYEWQPNDRWSLYGKAGVAVNLGFQQKAEIVNLTGLPEKYVSENAGPGYPFRSKISLSPFVNAGARFRLTDHLSVFGEMRYLHQGSEITADDYPVRQQYKLPGVNVGAHYQF
jgi:opacity protein-like surface antigen